MSLKYKTVSGITWQVVLQAAQKILAIITTAFLARILEPSVFGLFALAFVLIDGLSLFKAFGIDACVIQKKDCDERTQNTAFFMVQITGIVVFVICFILAPYAAKYFRNKEVVTIIQALGLIFIVNGFGKIPSALLTKAMRFRLISIIQIIGGIINSVVAIILAIVLKNVWSIVIAYLVKTVVMDVLSWYFSGFRLKFQFEKGIARELLRFGSFLMSGSAISFVTQNLNSVVVGRMLGTTLVGYLALAGNLACFINIYFTQMISRVLFPAYSSIQHDRDDLRRVSFKVVKFTTMFTIPFSVAIILLAKELVLTIYGSKWLPIIPIVQIAAVIQLMVSITCSLGPIYMACGKPKYLFHLSLLDLVVRIPAVLIFTKYWGLIGTISADLATNLVLMPIGLEFMRRTLNFRYGSFFSNMIPAFYCTALMAFTIVCIKYWNPLNSFSIMFFGSAFSQLLVYSLIGCMIYIVSFFFADKPTVIEIKKMVLNIGRAF